LTAELDFIHRWIPGTDPGRTLLLLHGTGGNEDSLMSLGRTLAPNAGLLGVRGKVLENGMPRFFRRLAEGVFDEADLARRTAELIDFLPAAAAQYGFVPASLVAVGYSNGANIAASVLLTAPGTLPRAILLRAMVPFTPATPLAPAPAAVLIAAGRHDPIVPRDQPETLAGLLRAAGAEVEVHWEDVGHELTQADVQTALVWLAD
jgi:phospholipase/carboxylesterase